MLKTKIWFSFKYARSLPGHTHSTIRYCLVTHVTITIARYLRIRFRQHARVAMSWESPLQWPLASPIKVLINDIVSYDISSKLRSIFLTVNAAESLLIDCQLNFSDDLGISCSIIRPPIGPSWRKFLAPRFRLNFLIVRLRLY